MFMIDVKWFTTLRFGPTDVALPTLKVQDDIIFLKSDTVSLEYPRPTSLSLGTIGGGILLLSPR